MAQAEGSPISHIDREQFIQEDIVVTGVGLITPLGFSAESTWENALSGKIGISTVDIPNALMSVAGSIDSYDKKDFKTQLGKEVDRMSRPVQFSTIATFEALMQAGLIDESGKLVDGIDPKSIGVEIGTGMGNWHFVTEVAEAIANGKKVGPFDMLKLQPERVASVPSRRFGLQGPVESNSAACATGNIAIINGAARINMGDADIMVVGGAEAALNAVSLTVFGRALSTESDPQRASLPLDNERAGFVPAEGAGILILERASHAKMRGAKPIARFAGYALGADADTDTAPNEERVTQVLQLAFDRAGVKKGDHVYVNAHSTATGIGDPVEMRAIRTIIGEDNIQNVTVNAPKALIGHGIGAAGATESILTILSLRDGRTFPSGELRDPIDETQGMTLPRKEGELLHEGIEVAFNNGFGFGGLDGVTAWSKVRE